jgi:hypothetical protein
MNKQKGGTEIFLKVLAAVLALALAACTPPVSDMSSLYRASSAPTFPYDPDLDSWSTASWTPFTVNDSVTGFAWGRGSAGEIYVAVSSTGKIAYSQDGDIWEQAVKAPKEKPTDPDLPDPFAGVRFNDVTFGGGVFIAVGNDDKIARSQDGKNWSAGKTNVFTGVSPNNSINSIAYGTVNSIGYFVAVGSNTDSTAKIAYSTDGGATWIFVWVNQFQNIQLRDIVYGDGKFFVAGDGGNVGWSGNPSVNPTDADWHHYHYSGIPINNGTINKIAYGGYGTDPGIAVVYNDGSGTSRNIAVIKAVNFANPSPDPANPWDANLDMGAFGGNVIRGIAFGGGNFVAAGQSSMIGFWPSANPAVNRFWRALPFYEFRGWEIITLAALNGRFYAGHIGGKIGYSR